MLRIRRDRWRLAGSSPGMAGVPPIDPNKLARMPPLPDKAPYAGTAFLRTIFHAAKSNRNNPSEQTMAGPLGKSTL